MQGVQFCISGTVRLANLLVLTSLPLASLHAMFLRARTILYSSMGDTTNYKTRVEARRALHVAVRQA